jgi:hypothetical protein
MLTVGQCTDPQRHFVLVGIAVASILTGAVIGALTSPVNG